MLPSSLLLLLLCLLHCQASIAFPSPFASTFDVVEESPPGSMIPGVADYLKRIVLLRVEMPNSTTFQLMGTDALTKSFVINEKSGELRTMGRIDRETLCSSEVDPRSDLATDSNCLKPLNVLIKSLGIGGASGSNMREKIMLRILDINDNAPRWPGKRLLTVKFVEAFQSLSMYGKQEMTTQSQLLDRAIDPDSGPNGTVSYSLKGTGADMFRLEYADHENGRFVHPDVNSPLRLKPVVPLDREIFEFYNLTLFAYDSGNPQRSSSIPLHVYITDVNDHVPVFHSYVPGHVSAYPRESKQGELVKYVPERGHLMETARIGSVVLQLNATDEDAGDNARITYSIFPSDAAFVQTYFALDPITGYLTVKQRLDYDSGPRRFTFKVLAVDGAPEPYRLTGTALVDIELTDYNDEPPNIEILIAQNGNLNSISNVNMNGGITPMIPPGSRHQELVAYIEESPSPDIVIAYVQVSDKDENGEDQVECHLGARDNFTLQADSSSSGGKMDHFGFETASLNERASRRISEYRVLAKVPSGGDQSTGEASSLQDRLDRETTPSQLLTIICEDRNGNHAEIRIRLHLLDINDNPPRFLNDSYFNFSLAENREPVGNQQVWLGRVQAVDPDLGENARISYHLAPDQSAHLDGQFGSSPQQLFRVQPDTGDIYAQVSLDRENAPENGVYSFNVLAMDHGKPQQLTGTARVDVTVLDVNDWPPEFTRDIYTFEVPEDLELREVVGVVEAVDRDATAGANSITYHLNPPRAGLVQRSLKNETVERRKRDSMMQQQQQPLFMPHLEPSKVRDERPLSYFSIDSRTGEIRVIRKLDRESNGYFTFEVLAIDSLLAGSSAQSILPSQPSQPTRRGFKGGEVFTATATVVVTLTDVNDNAPEFRYPNTSILLHMAPGETLGHKILTVQAVDADYGENARISYSIRSEIPIPQDGPGTGNFAIDETSGLIFLTRPIQGPVNHRLVIEACDHGGQPKCVSSPAIQIAVSEDAKLVGGSVGSGGNVAGNGGGGGAINGGGGVGGRALDRSDVSGSDHRFNNLDGFYDSLYDHNPPHRVEVIAACLVVVFGVLLLAAIVLVCLLKRRPLVNGQQRPNHQNQQHQGRLDYTCTPLWNCQWSFFRHQKSTNAKRNAQHYVPTQTQEVLNDPRFSDGQSIESSVAKGMISTDSITNTLEEEKKPLYYDGLGVLALDAMASRGLRHPVEYSTGEGGGGGGGMPVPVVFTGHPPRVYGTLPVVSTILSDGQTATNTLVARPGFQPRSGRGHPTNVTPPSPDYQSLDQLAARPIWQAGPHHGVDMFVGSPRTSRPINNNSVSSSSTSYGCLIDPPCINTPRRNNHYEVSSSSGGRPRQRSATLGRLGAMTEEPEAGENDGTTGPIGGKRGGVLTGGSSVTTRSYSQLQATSGVETDAVERDRPTRYTYQAIREASFV